MENNITILNAFLFIEWKIVNQMVDNALSNESNQDNIITILSHKYMMGWIYHRQIIHGKI